MKRVMFFMAILLLVGCSNPVNRHTAIRYAEQAESEMIQGNWFNARMGLGRAITNAKIGGFDDRSMSILWYQYGRSSGVICDWAEAERGFEQSYELDKKTGTPAYTASAELAEMYLFREMYKQAVEYFDRAHTELIEAQVDKQHPLSYVVFLKDYADALDHVNQKQKANEYREKAEAVLMANPVTNLKERRTPYGQQCHATP